MSVKKEVDTSESKLINALAHGDERAFGWVFDNFSKKVYALARKSDLSHVDSEGIVQDVFLKIWERRRFLNPDLSFSAYIFTISKSMIIRKRKRILLELAYQRTTSLIVRHNSEPSSDEKVIFDDLMKFVRNLIDKLPHSQKRAFIMKNFDHLSVEEIAVLLNVPKRKVENQISRANKSLREKLSSKKWGIISVSVFIVNWFIS